MCGMSKRALDLYWDDLRDALRKIQRYIKRFSFLDFTQDQKTIDAVIRNLEIIGEVASRIPKETREQYPEIPWVDMIGMRNKVIHEYFGVDLEILWRTIEEDLPILEKQIKLIRKKVS